MTPARSLQRPRTERFAEAREALARAIEGKPELSRTVGELLMNMLTAEAPGAEASAYLAYLDADRIHDVIRVARRDYNILLPYAVGILTRTANHRLDWLANRQRLRAQRKEI